MRERILTQPKISKKPLIITVIAIVAISAGFVSIDAILGNSQTNIPDTASFAGIISVEHPDRWNFNSPLTINITYAFGNSNLNLHIETKIFPIAHRLELVFWRPPGLYPCIYEVSTYPYNITLPKSGNWIIVVNPDHGGIISSISILK